MTSSLIERDQAIFNEEGFNWIISCDEVGAGCAAGEVVVVAFAQHRDAIFIDHVKDSKKITSESKRCRIAAELKAVEKTKWISVSKSPKEIDKINIFQARMRAMSEAALLVLSSLPKNGKEKFLILVDGNKIPEDLTKYCKKKKNVEVRAIVKGDSKHYSIAAASILAKVTRDNIMNDFHNVYPVYLFNRNKGYPTKAHKAAIKKYGICPLHRKTWKTVKDVT
jgi:ribonuclease HII